MNKKGGGILGQNSIFETVFTFFENNRLIFVERQFEYKHISVRNKRFGKNRTVSTFWQKWVQIGQKRGTQIF